MHADVALVILVQEHAWCSARNQKAKQILRRWQ